jgi:hypothetical protein
LALDEAQQISRSRARLVEWLASRGGSERGRVLFLLGGSFDADPTDFYLRLAAGDPATAERTFLAEDLRGLGQMDADQELGAELAAWGWLVFPIAPADVGFSEFGSASEGGHSRWVAMSQGARGSGSRSAPFLFTDPGGSWRPLADQSGGSLIRSQKDLLQATRRLDETYLVSYERAGLPTGRRFRLEVVRSSDGARLEAPRWKHEGTPDSFNAVRAAQVGAEPNRAGGLAVSAEILSAAPLGRGERVVRMAVAFRPTAPGVDLSASIRIALAVSRPGDTMVTRAAAGGGSTPGRVVTSLRLPADAEEVGIAVEDTITGLWGAARVKLPAVAN